MPATRITVSQRAGRHRVALSTGVLRPLEVHSRPGWCRVGLVATTALLLGGDAVELDVQVGPGARLDLFDVAGTVALHGRGASATWAVRIHLEAGAELRMSGQPFVVAAGARVTRSLRLVVDGGAQALLRDTVVLGRHGEQGGWLRTSTEITRDCRPVLVEDAELDPCWRGLPGLLGAHRVIDTITSVGSVLPDPGQAGVAHFRLSGDQGVLRRYLGGELADSPLHDEWRQLTDDD